MILALAQLTTACLGGLEADAQARPSADSATVPADALSEAHNDPSGAPRTVSGHGTVGLEWAPSPDARSYRVYWSTSPGVTASNAEGVLEDAQPGVVHRDLVNGQTYHYRVAALSSSGDAELSAEARGVPQGEFVLEQLGSGAVLEFARDNPMFVPIERRIHVVLAAEGYTQADRTRFDLDVREWLQEVFQIEPYRQLGDAFVVWSLPRVSQERLPGSETAFGISATNGNIRNRFEQTARVLWGALDNFPYPLQFGPMVDQEGRTALNLVVSFLVFDPRLRRAGFSGLARGLSDLSGKRRVQIAVARGHAHEFTHAFARLKDEYLDHRNESLANYETSNVVSTSRCSELPWQHLLPGSPLNPTEEPLIGAFGRSPLGFHPELKCLMNGTHDNADFYGADGRLRAHDRLCNWCRELAAFRVYERLQRVTSFEAWKSHYRTPFYQRLGVALPDLIPQRNNGGQAYFEPCTP